MANFGENGKMPEWWDQMWASALRQEMPRSPRWRDDPWYQQERLTDADVDRIAHRVAEKLKETK